MLAYRRVIAFAISAIVYLNYSCYHVDGANLYEGSSCKMKDGKAGVCQKLSNCKSINDALMNRRFPISDLVICSFVGRTEIICCPDLKTPTTSDSSLIVLNQTVAKNGKVGITVHSTTSVISQPTDFTSSMPSLKLEEFVTVGDIHISKEAEYIDLTKLMQKPASPVTERNQKLTKTSPFSPSSIFEGKLTTSTKRPSAWIRDLVDDSTTRWPTTSSTTPTPSTILFPVSSWKGFESSWDLDENSNSRENDLKPLRQSTTTKRPLRSPYWSGYNWRKSPPTTTTTTTSRPKKIRTKPSPDVLDSGDFPKRPQPNGGESSWIPEISPCENHFTMTTKRPTSPRIVDTTPEIQRPSEESFIFPSSFFPDNKPNLLSSISSTTSTSTSRPLTTPFNSISEVDSSVLDAWMINVLLEVSNSPTTGTSIISSSSSSPPFPAVPNSPDDNNEISPSPNPRQPETPRPTPLSRASDNKADKVCSMYETQFQKLPKFLDYHILDGEPSFLGEFPHMAALGYPADVQGDPAINFRCGGSLISDRYVLTASHCVNRPESWPTVIRLGTVHVNETSTDSTDVGVETIILHPEYKTSRQYHDIALIRLNTTLRFTSPYIFPACLKTEVSEIEPNSHVVATGWGSISVQTRETSNILLKVNLTTVNFADCHVQYLEYGTNRRLPNGLNSGQLCAYDPKSEKDTCEGDSGGPLQIPLASGISKVVGVTSFGISCGSSIPSVYARVSYYSNWIESIVWPDPI